ncbi:MAG TPA: protein kinase, partial [Pyrinomonadaceae bacterium]
GMGEVYLAEDKGLERQVALKFFDADLADNEWAREQLMAEARAVAKLEHANICAVHEFKRVDEYSFIVMQYVEGETLEELLKRDSLDVNHAIKLAEQLVSGLAAAHGRGIIHRDIKPRNLMVTPEGQIKVLDFGLAKHVRTAPVEHSEGGLNTTELGIAAGTAAYMSPEQSNAESLDFRSDIFSFGIVFYEMLTGENPFLRGTRDATIDAIRNSEPPPPAKKGKPVRRELRDIVATCLAKDREQRFASTRDLLAALNTEHAQIEHLEPAAIRARMQRRRKRIRLIAAVTVPLLILLLIGANYARLKLTRTHSLAILKIDNKSDREMKYLSDGLTRNLLAKFSYFGRIKTKAPTDAGARADEPPDVLSLGRELNVEAILYGELTKVNGAQLLHLRLMDTATGKVEWEQTYDLATLDLFTLQNDIAARVMSQLGLWLTPSERNLIERRQTTSQEALEDYMRGRYYLDLKRDRDDMGSAVNYFDQAIAIDPAFARAFAARADCYIFMANVAWGPIPIDEAID